MKRPFILQGAVLLCLLLGHISAESNTEACKGYDCLEDAVCPPDSSIDDDYYDDNIVFDDLIEDIKDSERHIPPRFQRSITNLFAKCCSIDKVCKCNANACKLPVCTNSTHIPIRTRIASHSPGDCCDEYKCQPEPKCSEDSTDEWHTECKECKCIFGQVMCALIENCEVQPEGCYSQDLKKTFHHEEQWKEMNDCMECECSDGETKCIQIDCKVPDCENPIKIPGQCCRVCPVIQPSSTTESQEIPPIQNATTEGPTGCLSSTLHKFFKHGEEWKEAEDCMDCSCNDGDIRCTSTFCKPLDCEVSVKVPGQCCKVCVEPATTTSTTTTTTTASTTTMEPEEDNLLLPRDFFNPFTYGIALVLILLATIPFLVWYYCYRQHHQSCHLVATTMDNKYSSIEQSESTVTTAPSTPTMR